MQPTKLHYPPAMLDSAVRIVINQVPSMQTEYVREEIITRVEQLLDYTPKAEIVQNLRKHLENAARSVVSGAWTDLQAFDEIFADDLRHDARFVHGLLDRLAEVKLLYLTYEHKEDAIREAKRILMREYALRKDLMTDDPRVLLRSFAHAYHQDSHLDGDDFMADLDSEYPLLNVYDWALRRGEYA